MLKIQDRLDSLQPFIQGIRYVNGIQLVDAQFKNGWTVPDSDTIDRAGEGNHFIFFSEEEGITVDDILDFIQSVINLNVERELKDELFKVKVKELEKIFNDNSLEDLDALVLLLSNRDKGNDFVSSTTPISGDTLEHVALLSNEDKGDTVND